MSGNEGPRYEDTTLLRELRRLGGVYTIWRQAEHS